MLEAVGEGKASLLTRPCPQISYPWAEMQQEEAQSQSSMRLVKCLHKGKFSYSLGAPVRRGRCCTGVRPASLAWEKDGIGWGGWTLSERNFGLGGLNRGKEETHTYSSGIHSIDVQAGELLGQAGPGSGHGLLGPTAGRIEPPPQPATAVDSCPRPPRRLQGIA